MPKNKLFMNNKLISVVICVKNGEQTIIKCIESILRNNPYEIIIVDGNSTDKTIEICKNFNVKILKDDGRGLGYARNLALDYVKTKFIFYVGPDDILTDNSLNSLIEYFEKVNWVGMSPLVEVIKSNKTYAGKCLNLLRKIKNFEGEKKIIGTPWIYYTHILKKYRYDNYLTYSDDSDLSQRMQNDNLKVGVSNVLCFTSGDHNLKTVISRWKMYGQSDSEYYNKYILNLNLKRKLISLLSPLKKELFIPLISFRVTIIDKLYMLPYLLLLVISRYYGWIISKKINGR